MRSTKEGRTESDHTPTQQYTLMRGKEGVGRLPDRISGISGISGMIRHDQA